MEGIDIQTIVKRAVEEFISFGGRDVTAGLVVSGVRGSHGGGA